MNRTTTIIKHLVRMNEISRNQAQINSKLEKLLGNNDEVWDLIGELISLSKEYEKTIDHIYGEGFTMDQALELKNRRKEQTSFMAGGLNV